MNAPSFSRERFLAVYLSLVAISILVNYPGRLNPDSVYMLWEGQNAGVLNDWHSPFVTFVYLILSPAFGSPAGALVAQSMLLLVLPALWAVQLVEADMGRVRRVMAWTIWLATAATFIVLAGQIVKDELGLCWLSLPASLVVYRGLRPATARPMDQLAIGLCLIAFVLVRPTGLPTVFFATIAYLFACVERSDRTIEILKAAALMAAATASLVFTPPLLGAQKAHPENTVIVFDLAGMSTALHEDLFAPVLPANEPRHAPWDCYQSKDSNDFFWGKCKEYQALVEQHQQSIAAAWMQALIHHPVAYLHHRAAFALHVLLITWVVPAPPDFVSSVANTTSGFLEFPKETVVGLSVWNPTISVVPLGRIADLMLNTPVSSGVFRIAMLVLLPLLAFRRLERRAALKMIVVSAFGLANVIVTIFAAPAADARYLLPTGFCVAFEVVTLVLTPWMNASGAVERTRRSVACERGAV